MLEFYNVESRKGGVGKTTVALNLARALAKKNYDVLLIDCDITGTPITKASMNSPFWKNHVALISDEVGDSEGTVLNLISYYKRVFLKGKSLNNRLSHKTINGRIQLIGSDIYDANGSLIIDPRDLMDDLHSFWFLEMIEEIIHHFCEESELPQQAVVLDNSPGYVGIGKSIREWLTKKSTEKTSFVLVSSLDEQDIQATIASAIDIHRMVDERKEPQNQIRVIINKVPEEVFAESSGYSFSQDIHEQNKDFIEALFPLDKNQFPKNYVKYDNAISSQFIEARLKPIRSSHDGKKNLKTAFGRVEKGITKLENDDNKCQSISYLSTSYHVLLKELSKAGYIRLSKTLAGEEFLPETIIKKMIEVIERFRGRYEDSKGLELTKHYIKDVFEPELKVFVEKFHLNQYYSVFNSLIQKLLKKAGIDRKDSSVMQLEILCLMISSFYASHEKNYTIGTDYRLFLKQRSEKAGANEALQGIEESLHNNIFCRIDSDYKKTIINKVFLDFYSTFCHTLLRLIDCERDYKIVLNSCRETIELGAKTMSEELVTYLKQVVYFKSVEASEKRFSQLVRDPFEMNSIQKLIAKYVLA